MSKYDRADTQVDGQINLEYFYGEKGRLIAVHRALARAQKNMSLAEFKTFVNALSKIKFKDEVEENTVSIGARELAKNIGINPDPDHLSSEINRAINQLPEHSAVKFSNEDKKHYKNLVLISEVEVKESRVNITFYPNGLSLFSGLSGNYITMWNADIYNMTSLRSIKFYEFLRQITDTRIDNNNVLLGVRALKELFDIPKTGKGSYMREKSGFDRMNFEKRVLDPVCEDLKKCSMIKLSIQPDGKFYEKVKSGRRVDGYKFYWSYTAHPAIADAGEVKQIQERVDKDPQVLKVAKDILKGKKKKQPKETSFNKVSQRDYDFDALEKKLFNQ